VLSVAGVSKRWGSRVVLADVNLSCGAGDIAVILGPNGTGKSSLLKIVAGLSRPDAGTVTLCGERVACGGVAGRRHLGVLADHADLLPDLSVGELASLAVALKGASWPPETLRTTLGLDDLWSQRLRTLSFGQRKRALLFTALVGDPWLLVLDEPSNGLDPAAVDNLLALLRRRRENGQGALVATNDARFAQELEGLGGQPLRLADGHLLPVQKTT
jgi:ABC-type multidrug transport system ATPase subunit